MTLDELKVEHARLVQQAEMIAAARRLMASEVTYDGETFTLDVADELTRVAIYQIECQLEAAGVYG